MKVYFFIPPFTQLNTAYPATMYLTGFLRSKNYEAFQADASIETMLAIFSKSGLTRIFNSITEEHLEKHENIARIYRHADLYISTITSTISFLRGKNPTLAHRICYGSFLPCGPRFDNIDINFDGCNWAFGTMGIMDHAKYIATLYLEDIVDFIQATVAPFFSLSKYAAHIATSATSFSPIYELLHSSPSVVDEILEEVICSHLQNNKKGSIDCVCLTIPFPGNLYGALRIAKIIKNRNLAQYVVAGGGYANTELRNLKDARFFEYIDFLCLDDGERPLLSLLEYLEGKKKQDDLFRTYFLEDGVVKYIGMEVSDKRSNLGDLHDIPFSSQATPVYDGIKIDNYISILEMLNPMHRIWNDGFWNKLTLAHGCYWKKCTFCDTSLDYIGRYETTLVNRIADKIEEIVKETGVNAFHFVDEAAPPLILRDLAIELLSRNIVISWWGNIRFEKTFSSDICLLLAESGAIAVTGGLEVASDRILKKIKKGVTIAQVANVAQAFTNAGIMVHAYLIYGFPTQTEQEIIDSLEGVRQMFEEGIIQSAFWHRFTATAHSDIGKNPSSYDIEITGPSFDGFAWNDLEYRAQSGCNADLFGEGLDTALYNYMHGQSTDADLSHWFKFTIPKPKFSSNMIKSILEENSLEELKGAKKVLWLGDYVEINTSTAQKNSKKQQLRLDLYRKGIVTQVTIPKIISNWLIDVLMNSRVRYREKTRSFLTLDEFMSSSPFSTAELKAWMGSNSWHKIRESGLLFV